jgi:hypothetical protein
MLRAISKAKQDLYSGYWDLLTIECLSSRNWNTVRLQERFGRKEGRNGVGES